MNVASTQRLCSEIVTFFRPDGSLMDLADPKPWEVDFTEVAFGLSKLARFTGTYTAVAYSISQHSVMGADAILNEGGDELTAALFLLHDGHEYKLGDDSRPKQDLLYAMLKQVSPEAGDAYRAAMKRAKAGWDAAIYSAAGLPAPSDWTVKQQKAVAKMDILMMAAEAEALFGSAARKVYPLSRYPAPLTRGSIVPWGAAKAEHAFLDMFDRLIGIKQRNAAANNHLIYRKSASVR